MYKMLSMNTSIALRNALQKRGMSMKEASNYGIPYGTIVAHCRGTRGMTLKIAQRYSKLLGIPLLEIIGEISVSSTDSTSSTPEPHEIPR